MPDHPGQDATAAVDDRRLVVWALQQRPARQRAAVVLRHYEDLSETDTAAAMGCSTGTVKSLTFRGLHRLRQLLASPTQAPLTVTEGA